MMHQDRSLELLLELADPAERRSRAQLIEQALRTALTLMDADAVSVVVHTPRRSERFVLHAGSAVPAALPLGGDGSAALKRLEESPEPLAVADLSHESTLASDACPGIDAGSWGSCCCGRCRRRGCWPKL